MRSAGAAEEGVLAGGHEAALDRAVLLCEAFAELDELEARIVGEADARAAARTARYTDAPDARGAGAAEGGTVGVLRNPNPHPHPNPSPSPNQWESAAAAWTAQSARSHGATPGAPRYPSPNPNPKPNHPWRASVPRT